MFSNLFFICVICVISYQHVFMEVTQIAQLRLLYRVSLSGLIDAHFLSRKLIFALAVFACTTG